MLKTRTDRLSILQWNVQQPAGHGGMWTLQDKATELYLSGANFDSVDVEGINEIFYWDIWPSSTTSGYYG